MALEKTIKENNTTDCIAVGATNSAMSGSQAAARHHRLRATGFVRCVFCSAVSPGGGTLELDLSRL